MNFTDLETAISEIKQACDGSATGGPRFPFFVIAGAGISHPPIPLAKEIETECKKTAAGLCRNTPPSGDNPIDTYSHWFNLAYPQPKQRQQYLRSMIEGKHISPANLRLAHLLGVQKVANLVVTPNFDDLLSKALSLFGIPHVVSDHPATVQRIDPEQLDICLLYTSPSPRD